MTTANPIPPADEWADRDTIVTVFGNHGELRAAPPGTARSLTEMVLNEPDELATATEPVQANVAHAPVRFKIRLANEQGARSKASYLIEKMYSWRGYQTTAPAPAPAPAAPPNRITLVASDHSRALATITIGFDSPAGLMTDELYQVEVDRLRATGARLCEFTKLAIDRDQQSKELLAMMFHIAYMYARRIHGATDLLIEVNPRHVRFYQRMLGFTEIGSERNCPRVGGALAILLRLELEHARTQIMQWGGRKEAYAENRSLYPFFFAPGEEEGIVGRLKAIG